MQICNAISALELRVERLEASSAKAGTGSKEASRSVEADIHITKDSLKKVRETIKNLFRI